MEDVLLIAGVDEVGGGDCIAGPVVAAAVMFDLTKQIDKDITTMKDSKKVFRKEGFEGIETRFNLIVEVCEDWRISSSSALEINSFRTGRCMSIARGNAVGFLKPRPAYIKTDGNVPIPPENIGFYVTQRALSRADELSWLVACASIVARYMRDTLMIDMHECCTDLKPYRFDKNFGRSTKEHLKALEEHGPSRMHRSGYKEVRLAEAARLDRIERGK